MKISFAAQETENQNTIKNTRQSIGAHDNKSAGADRAGGAYTAAFFAHGEDGWIQGAASGTDKRKKGKSLTELQQDAGNIDVSVRQDYMTIMANTMSETDFAKLEEEGFDFGSLDPETAVNIVDKIKAELARSGQYIAGYTDDLDMTTLSEALGSDSLARAVADSFRNADVPLTEGNLEEVKAAWEMASQLEEPADGARRYMVDNQAEPEIWDFYLAQSSGAGKITGTAPRYYTEDIQGYYAQSAGKNTWQKQTLQEQIDKMIASADMEVEKGRERADWLMEQGLPVTAENLLRLQELEKVTFPVTEEVFAQAAANAILEGKHPVHANLAQSYNIYEQASLLADRMKLEEVRLRMTAEVNVKLLKSGFAIDTAPMEELLEALQQAEQELAESYFPKDENALEKYGLYRQTTRVTKELPGLPIQVVGSLPLDTLADFHAKGKALQDTYDRARESYEALMTTPRKDMGDSIRKAFANVDAILEDLHFAVTEENQRAVRILGYNRMEMTAENLEEVKAADAQVRSVVARLTPSASLQMIRDGVNPLEMSFEELTDYLENQAGEYEETAESYSRFLYHLEQNKEITPEQREAYIGIYRLLRQLEKSDGAAVGAVVNTGAKLQFANLLSAVRSGRFRHMDVRVTDETGLLQDLVSRGDSISEQISDNLIKQAKQIMTEVSSDKEADAQYRKTRLEQIRAAAEAQPECLEMLERGGLMQNADNLLAAQGLLGKTVAPYARFKEKYSEDWLASKEEEEFVKEYTDSLEEIKAVVEQRTSEEAQTSVDVRQLQIVHKQLTIMTRLSDSKEYILPMYIGEELGRVHLRLAKEDGKKGSITIRVDWGEESRAEAHIQVSGRKIDGYLLGNTRKEVTKLEKAADIFHELLATEENGEWEAAALPVVNSTAAMQKSVPAQHEGASDTSQLYRIARLFLRAMKE